MYIGRYYKIRGKVEIKEMVSLIVNEIQEYVLKEENDEKSTIN